jgi:hypothetical protein
MRGYNGPRKDCGNIVIRSRGKTGVVPAVPAFSRCSSCFVGCLRRHDSDRLLRAESFDVQPSMLTAHSKTIFYAKADTDTAFGQRVHYYSIICIAAPSIVHFILPEASGPLISSHSVPRGDWSGHSTPPSSVGSLIRKSCTVREIYLFGKRQSRLPFRGSHASCQGISTCELPSTQCRSIFFFTEIHRSSAGYTIRFVDRVCR